MGAQLDITLPTVSGAHTAQDTQAADREPVDRTEA